MTNKTVVVTGASSGIGEATARRFAKAGFEVFAAARRMDRLEALAETSGITPLHLDVTDQVSVDQLAGRVQTCDVLVNNAGGAFGLDPVESGKIDDWQHMYDINVIGTLRVTQAMLPALRRSGNGDIVVLTSTASRTPYEGGAGYVAAKHAERVIAQTLRLELVGEPLRVIEVAPGMVKTEEFSKNRFEGNQQRADSVYDNVEGPLTADDIAECIYWTISLPAHVNIDEMVIRPRAQAANHKLHKGPLKSSVVPPGVA